MLPKGYKVGKDLYNSADNFGDRLKNIGVFAKKLLVELIQEDWFADGDVSKVDLEDNYKKLFLKVPYTLYYRMIGTEILNCYELPCDVRQLTRSVSSVGWSDQDSDFGLVGSMNSSSFLGKMMNWLGGGMAIRLQPRWNPQDTAPQSLQVSFYLFNDEVQRSVNNFIFLNTIMPGAMSMQWGICKHSPNLYDVKISGYTRMFLCSCDISVTMKGQIRKPSESFFQTLSKWSAIR